MNVSEQIQKVIPKPKPEPPSKPILAGIGAQQKPVKAMTQGVKPEKKGKMEVVVVTCACCWHIVWAWSFM